MPKISDSALREIEAALSEYRTELQASDLARNSQDSHYSGARTFVRWLSDNYQVGEGLERRRRRGA